MHDQIDAVDFYWRQGCGFCMALDRSLTRAGIPMNKKNIWDDPVNADVVRGVANGNETVPTVVVGDVALVNPRVKQVIAALEQEAPHLVPTDVDEPGAVSRFTQRIFGSN